MKVLNEEPAISVIEESANEFYGNYKNLTEKSRKRLSVEMLREMFNVMVVPAIDKARSLDREKAYDDDEL